MVIPHGNPWEVRMRTLQVQIRAIGTQPRTIVIQSENDSAIWRWHATNAISVAIISRASILVVIIAKMQDIIDAVLAPRVSVSIEEAEGILTARVHCETEFGDVIIGFWCCLGSTHWALVVAAAHVELEVVSRERLQAGCFHLDGVVDVGRSVCFPAASNVGEVLTF